MSEDLKAKDDHEATEKMIADSIVKFQTETLDTLSKRIDQNENHIKLLETKGPSIFLPNNFNRQIYWLLLTVLLSLPINDLV